MHIIFQKTPSDISRRTFDFTYWLKRQQIATAITISDATVVAESGSGLVVTNVGITGALVTLQFSGGSIRDAPYTVDITLVLSDGQLYTRTIGVEVVYNVYLQPLA